ncbi:MAG: proline/glycine betaine ABC transporter permease [Dehalococcoidales bacterium]|jgi:glycine betaine/proline transport system permease protein|nr:proline/glycine betaine ABC transporter permease [Dehalococcoidales bacterium]
MRERGATALLNFSLPKLEIGAAIEWLVRWIIEHLSIIFDIIKNVLDTITGGFNDGLSAVPPIILILIFALLIWLVTSKTTALLSMVGLALVWNIGLWPQMLSSLVLVVISVIIALLIGIPVGILMTRSSKLEAAMRPVLDFMQTMPAFVYLIPAVMLFGIGVVPGIFATIIFAIPPPVRLTYLGITQVPEDMKEMAVAFGASDRQVLRKVELPLSMPSIMAGVNQCIMLGISMVVIASMIGAGGLGAEVMRSVNRLDLALGFESGLAIVILAMVLDRVSRNIGSGKVTPSGRIINRVKQWRKARLEAQEAEAATVSEEVKETEV